MKKSDERSMTQAKTHSISTAAASLAGRGLRDLQTIQSTKSANPKNALRDEKRWHSPHADGLISGYDLLRELAVKTVCREYFMLKAIGCGSPDIILYSNGIGMIQDDIHYKGVTFFPDELYPLFEDEFDIWLNTYRGEYGLPGSVDGLIPPTTPSGEKLGRMLRNFDGLRELITICIAQRCWNKDNMLILHGLHSSYGEPSELVNNFDQAGIYYLSIFNDEIYTKMREGRAVSDEDAANACGCGAFVSVDAYEAANIALSLNEGDRDYVASLLNLEDDYRENSWASNHPNFNG